MGAISWTATIIGAAVIAFGCGDSPADLCNDFVDRFARASERCGFADYETARRIAEHDLVDTVGEAGSSCADADEIRDRRAFEEECLPWIESVSCDDLASGVTPGACYHQVRFYIDR